MQEDKVNELNHMDNQEEVVDNAGLNIADTLLSVMRILKKNLSIKEMLFTTVIWQGL